MNPEDSLRKRLAELRERERTAFVEVGRVLGAEEELERLINEWGAEQAPQKPEGPSSDAAETQE